MAKAKSRFNPIGFIKEVKSETRKVTWPTKDETIKSTIAVFIMVAVAALFLFLADQVIAFAIRLILGL
jgi:preprotein translocase subunit SecE